MAKKTNTQRIEELEAKFNETDSKIERHLIENARISTLKSNFELGLRIAEFFFIAILGTWLTCNSNQLLKNSNTIMNKSNEIQKDGTEKSIALMDKSNLILAHSDSLMNNSNNISLSGLDIQKNSITVMENSNRLVELSNKLEESSRKSAMIPIIESTIDRFNDETGEYTANKQDAELSSSLIENICAQSQLLTPYYILEDENKKGVYLSPGRGRLLRIVLSVQMNEKTLKSIFEQSNFKYSDLRQVFKDSITIVNASLSHSYLSEAKITKSRISNTDLNYSDLNDAKFEYCILNNKTTLNNCNLNNSSFKGCIIEDNVEFLNTAFNNVNLAKTKFRNIKTYKLDGPFYSCNLSCTEFDGVFFNKAEFRNCRWEGAKFIKCSLGISNLNINDVSTFKDLPKSNIQGLNGNSRMISENVKVKLYQTTLSPNNTLLLNSHFREYHIIKDTIVSNQKLMVANYIGDK